MTYVDLHLHLLPGIDDGAPDLDASLGHAQRMVAAGVSEAAVTPHIGSPHFPVELAAIPEHTAALQAELDREGIALTLHAGGEIHPASAAELTPSELESVAHGPSGARWVLAEVPFAGIDTGFAAGIHTIMARGYGVLIAHPERARGVLDGGLRLLRPAIEAGAVLQVNACSLLGHHGPEAADAARRLVRTRMAYIIGSDGHPGTRDHVLTDARAPALAAGASAAQAEQLLQANPRFLLRHGLPAVGALTAQRGRGRRSLERARTAARRFDRPA